MEIVIPMLFGPFLVSPAEKPPQIRALGISSSLPEKYGSDVLFSSSKMGLIGIQRKVFPDDFISSLRGDTRVTREIQDMQKLALGIWVLEGEGNWTGEGYLMYAGRYKFYLEELWGTILALSIVHGYLVIRVRHTDDFCRLVHQIRRWSEKDDHGSLLRRNKPGIQWGGGTGEMEWMKFFYQGINGIGQEGAEKLTAAFGSIFQLKPGVAPNLASVIGPSLAASIIKQFGDEGTNEELMRVAEAARVEKQRLKDEKKARDAEKKGKGKGK